VKFTHDGKEWETDGEYRSPKIGEWFISWDGKLDKAVFDAIDKVRLIIRPVPVQHVFGGIVFEETGEERPPRKGEWFLSKYQKDTVLACASGDYSEYVQTIVKPVRIQEGE